MGLLLPRERGFAADAANLRFCIRDGGWWPNIRHPLSDFGLFVTDEGWTIGKAELATNFVDMPTMDGSLDLGVEDATGALHQRRRTIEINVAAVGDETELTETTHGLAQLAGKTVRVWGLLPNPEWHVEGRLSTDAITNVFGMGGRRVTIKTKLTINALPFAFGRVKTIRLDAGSARVVTGGDAPTWPDLIAFPHVTGQGVEFGTADESFRLASSAKTFDTWLVWPQDRIVGWQNGQTVNSNGDMLPTLDSDWFPLDPVVEVDTNPSAVITLRPAFRF